MSISNNLKIIMEKMNDLRALLQHEVQDLISAEDQIIEAMPAMIERAQNENLKRALQEHLTITEKQRSRLDRVQELMSEGEKQEEAEEKKGFLSGLFDSIGGQTCKGMQGVISEGQKIMKADMTPEVMDAAIIACSQKIEHYEICGYGTAKAYAGQLNLNEVERLLDETLNEEYDADDRLTVLAVGSINERAERGNSRSRNNGKASAANGKSATNQGGKNQKGVVKKGATGATKKVATKKAAVKKSVATKSAPKKAAGKKTAAKKAGRR